MTRRNVRQLRRLAALHRVQTSYIDMHGRRRFASPEALLAVLQSLGAPLAGMGDVDDAIQARRDQIIGEWLPPVLVSWDGESDQVCIRIPSRAIPSHAIGPPSRCQVARLQYALHLENGDIWSGNVPADQARPLRHVTCGGVIAAVKAVLPPRTLPLGYHKLTVLIGSRAFHSSVIAAPRQSFHNADRDRRGWGVFAPTYSLQSERNWGVGDFTDAEALVSWAGEQGGSLFGTLPFLASYLDHPCDPSPYTPISRLFWNELFVDVTRLPELSACLPAQELIASPAYQSDLRALRAERLVDYRRAMQLKRDVLFLLSRHLRESGGMRYDAWRTHGERHPELRMYARFRAATTHEGDVWTRWPSQLHDGNFEDSDIDREEECYHLYAQFVASEQVEGLTKRCDAENVALYLDYPLGTHPEGFDTWRYRHLFALEATVGAPPDPVFTTGQNWGFHPLLPEEQRRDRYRYFASTLRHQMRHAGLLRLDHVMGLHRLYWIPKGFQKSEGVYVHSPSRELYAVLTLESHRTKTSLVGEDLGIVPGYVGQAMERHGLTGMNIAYWDLTSDPNGALQRMAERPKTVASLNTHDMFPFAAFWHALDADRRAELGMITQEQADFERWSRGDLRARLIGYLREHGYEITGEDDTDGALRGILSLLAGSSARWVLINLEDLWLESSPQNIPDTIEQHPNWRQKAKMTMEQLIRDERIRGVVEMVHNARTEARS